MGEIVRLKIYNPTFIPPKECILKSSMTDFNSMILCRQAPYLLESVTSTDFDNALHLFVQEINSKLELLDNNTSYVDLIDENWKHINPGWWNNFKPCPRIFIESQKKTKDIAAYNVAKYTESTNDVKVLTIPLCPHNLVSIFLDAYSGNHLSV